MKGKKQNPCVGTKLDWLGRTGIRRECEFLKATSAAQDIASETDRGTRCSMPANSIFAFQYGRTVGVYVLFRSLFTLGSVIFLRNPWGCWRLRPPTRAARRTSGRANRCRTATNLRTAHSGIPEPRVNRSSRHKSILSVLAPCDEIADPTSQTPSLVRFSRVSKWC